MSLSSGTLFFCLLIHFIGDRFATLGYSSLVEMQGLRRLYVSNVRTFASDAQKFRAENLSPKTDWRFVFQQTKDSMIKVGLGALIFGLSLGIAKQRGDFKKQQAALQEQLDASESVSREVAQELRSISAGVSGSAPVQLRRLADKLSPTTDAVTSEVTASTAMSTQSNPEKGTHLSKLLGTSTNMYYCAACSSDTSCRRSKERRVVTDARPFRKIFL